MSIVLDGTNGISDVDGSASTPAIRGTDSNTGIFFPAADTVAISEGGVESARFNSSGNLQLVNSLSVGNATPTTSGAGITFPATQSASTDANTLDDYEEGTWTPTIKGDGTAGTYQLDAVTTATYTKIGRLVTLTAYIKLASSITAGGTGDMQIAGLPFTIGITTDFAQGAVLTNGINYTTANGLVIGPSGWGTGQNTLYVRVNVVNAAPTFVPISGVSAADYIAFTFTCITT